MLNLFRLIAGIVTDLHDDDALRFALGTVLLKNIVERAQPPKSITGLY